MKGLPIDWRVVTLFLGTTLLSGICILIPFWVISQNDRLIDMFSKGNPAYLRFVTVILVVWYVSILAVQGQMNEGTAAIFGMIVGYVFGAVNRQNPHAP
jgi:hypothetical protein